MRSRADPCCATYSNADVAISVDVWLGCVDDRPYTHDLGGRERALCCDGRRDGIDGTLEDDRTRRPPHRFVTTMRYERFAEEPTVLRAKVAVRSPVHPRQLGRPFDALKRKVTVPSGRPASTLADDTPRTVCNHLTAKQRKGLLACAMLGMSHEAGFTLTGQILSEIASPVPSGCVLR